MASMAGVLEEAIPEIDNGNDTYHVVCFCDRSVALCGKSMKGHGYTAHFPGWEERVSCLDCYVANKDPYYRCPNCGE